MESDAWKNFNSGNWKKEIDVRDFIQKNYTPYEGDEAFLAGPTERTQKLWDKVQELYKKEKFPCVPYISFIWKTSSIGIINWLILISTSDFKSGIIIGLISNSRAMIADSFNSAGDIFASFMTWLGNRISSVPNDNDHNFGHGKAQYIFSMLIGISMMIVAIKLLYDSVISLVYGNIVNYSLTRIS